MPSDMPEPVFGRTAGGFLFLTPLTSVLGEVDALVGRTEAGGVVAGVLAGVEAGVLAGVEAGVLGGVVGVPVQMWDSYMMSSPPLEMPSPGKVLGPATRVAAVDV
jgi:hypothetical protein